MSLAAMGNALCSDMLVEWFHADRHIRTIDLLLNERVPWELPPELTRDEMFEVRTLREGRFRRCIRGSHLSSADKRNCMC
jgi:cyclic beta-1,2-glucan synthetase